MGMSTHVVGFKPPDEKWKKMKKVWDACTEAGLEIPDEVGDFFEWEDPDPAGVKVAKLVPWDAVTEHTTDNEHGYDIHIERLCVDIKIVRVYNSW